MALRQVIGAYAIAILDKRNPNQIIAARKQSPLVVGIGKDGEFYLGSDASPIIEYTDKVVYLEDGNIAVMRLGEELQVVNIQNVKLNPEVQTVDIDLGQIEKGGFPHFMLKEIFEQPECLRNCMRGRVVSRTVETRVMTDGDDTTSKKETEWVSCSAPLPTIASSFSMPSESSSWLVVHHGMPDLSASR